MVIDTSALIAIILDENERIAMVDALAGADLRNISTATLLETNIVLYNRSGADAISKLHRLIEAFHIAVLPFDTAQLAIATGAFLAFGKGRNPARLNFGDLFSYALAKAQGETLLFKCDDFAQTDILPAWTPRTNL